MARTKIKPIPIPKRMRIGKRVVTVKLKHTEAGVLGSCLGGSLIEICTHDGKRALSASQINETFWHELTHAVLHAMGKPIKQEERFVQQFARFLSQAINTAKF